jgi:hypothetical protein
MPGKQTRFHPLRSQAGSPSIYFLTPTRDVINQELSPAPSASGPSRSSESTGTLAVVVRDTTNWLSNVRHLQETDVIILLTPVVVPISQDPTDTSDPFEPLGRSLARRHARVRQIPYTQRFGNLNVPCCHTDLLPIGTELLRLT